MSLEQSDNSSDLSFAGFVVVVDDGNDKDLNP
jgi:hypothetical protein